MLNWNGCKESEYFIKVELMIVHQQMTIIHLTNETKPAELKSSIVEIRVSIPPTPNRQNLSLYSQLSSFRRGNPKPTGNAMPMIKAVIPINSMVIPKTEGGSQYPSVTPLIIVNSTSIILEFITSMAPSVTETLCYYSHAAC